MDQKAHENASNQIRFQKRTFTSRLTNEITRIVNNKNKSSIAFAEIIAAMRKPNNLERLSEYSLRRGQTSTSESQFPNNKPHQMRKGSLQRATD